MSEPQIDTWLDLARRHLRIDHDDEDDDIGRMVSAAKGYIEAGYGTVVDETEKTLTLARFPQGPIKLVGIPVTSVDSIEYDDAAGVEQTLSADYYRAVLTCNPARVDAAIGTHWPHTRGNADDVRVTYTAGHDGLANTPDEVVQAVLVLVGHYYEFRELGIAGAAYSPITITLNSLMANHQSRVES